MIKAVALKSLADQDWKTQLARGYSSIPRGAVVDVINDNFTNFYGTWCEVIWNNNHYYVSKSDLSFNELDIKNVTNYIELEKYISKFK